MNTRNLILGCLAMSAVACGGGGGGGGTGSAANMPDTPTPDTPSMSDLPEEYSPSTQQASGNINSGNQQQNQAIGNAATAQPKFGSVTQSAGPDGSAITTDTAQATFDGQDIRVTVTRGDGSRFTFASTDAAWLEGSFEPSELLISAHTNSKYSYHTDIGSDYFHAAYIESSWGSQSDFLAGGYWLRAEGDPYDSATLYEAGAFVDGPEIDHQNPPTLPVAGTATYRGGAQGVYYHEYHGDSGVPRGTVEIGQYFSTATLTVDFAQNSILYGCHDPSFCTKTQVSGHAVDPDGNVYEFQNIPTDYVYEGTATLQADGSFRSTSVTLSNATDPISSHSGSFGGQFSNIPDANGDPRLIAGTTGGKYTHADGDFGAWVGAFLLTK